MGQTTIESILEEHGAFGSERAVSRNLLQGTMRLSTRATYKAIQQERENGAPICANDKGYFLPNIDDPEAAEAEVAETAARLRAQGKSLVRTADAMAEEWKVGKEENTREKDNG